MIIHCFATFCKRLPCHQAKVYGFCNEKGGVAKTTSATEIAYLFATHGKKTLLIDFDGQANATMIMDKHGLNTRDITIATLMQLVIQEKELPPPDQYIVHCENGVDLIPSCADLFSLESELSTTMFREYKLTEIVTPLRSMYDIIILDTMPQLGIAMVNAMMCIDRMIIPTHPAILSVQGLSRLLNHFEKVRRSCNAPCVVEGILVTADRADTKTSAYIKESLTTHFADKWRIFSATVPNTIKVPEAHMYQQTISAYMPKNAAAVAYADIFRELTQNQVTPRKEGYDGQRKV